MKRILVVDDYFEMLSFLRSMLELSNQDYRVVGVPSAEEGMLELRQKSYDLLITDLRLPGISGFELVRRARRVHPYMPVIMITAYTSDQGQQEAADLNIFRYFRKPLDTDELLAAVHAALYGAALPAAPAPPAAASPPVLANDVARRLTMLRADTAATQVVLARMDGELVHDTGGRLTQEMPQLVAAIAHIMAGSYELARQLGSDEPFTMQYQAGQSVDVYSANVGTGYLISIFLDANARRGRIGTVWVFAQRAVNDLLRLLPPVPLPLTAALPAAVAEVVSIDAPVVSPLAVVVAEPPPANAPPLPAPVAPASTASAPAVSAPAVSASITPAPAEEVDLDAFWEQATQAIDEGEGLPGISWEEARQQGLIGKHLGEPSAAE